MANSKNYHHFCPVARSLEVIGEKWSLLLVRDLLRGPQRFSDLLRLVGGITPKWLTARLRELERAGIVERESKAGRREVLYRLTDKGRELGPVIQDLLVWGVNHALRPPFPGEAFHGEQAMSAIVAYHNAVGTRLPEPVDWVIQLDGEAPYTVSFDGRRWRWRQELAARADVAVTASHDAMADFLTTPRGQRHPSGLQIIGEPAQVARFLETLAVAGYAERNETQQFSRRGAPIANLYG